MSQQHRLEVPQVPDSYTLFAQAVADAARKHGIEKFSLEFSPDFETQISLQIRGAVKVSFSSKDGRGRPERSLRVSMETTVTKVLSNTE